MTNTRTISISLIFLCSSTLFMHGMEAPKPHDKKEIAVQRTTVLKALLNQHVAADIIPIVESYCDAPYFFAKYVNNDHAQVGQKIIGACLSPDQHYIVSQGIDRKNHTCAVYVNDTDSLQHSTDWPICGWSICSRGKTWSYKPGKHPETTPVWSRCGKLLYFDGEHFRVAERPGKRWLADARTPQAISSPLQRPLFGLPSFWDASFCFLGQVGRVSGVLQAEKKYNGDCEVVAGYHYDIECIPDNDQEIRNCRDSVRFLQEDHILLFKHKTNQLVLLTKNQDRSSQELTCKKVIEGISAVDFAGSPDPCIGTIRGTFGKIDSKTGQFYPMERAFKKTPIDSIAASSELIIAIAKKKCKVWSYTETPDEYTYTQIGDFDSKVDFTAAVISPNNSRFAFAYGKDVAIVKRDGNDEISRLQQLQLNEPITWLQFDNKEALYAAYGGTIAKFPPHSILQPPVSADSQLRALPDRPQ